MICTYTERVGIVVHCTIVPTERGTGREGSRAYVGVMDGLKERACSRRASTWYFTHMHVHDAHCIGL